MATKKSNTKKQTTSNRKQPTREQFRRCLAEDIASILANPETPRELYNAIATEMQEWQDARDNDRQSGWTSAGFILNCLEVYQRAEAERTKGGAR